MNQNGYHIAVIGAGPAGLFGARELANRGVKVTVFNRDVKPGGLAEYGIYPAKRSMKEGLRKQFRAALDHPNIEYYGNISIGRNADMPLEQALNMGFDATLVSSGAQGVKSLGLPGESLDGVYHAKEVVYFYNKLPPFTQKSFQFGKRCAIIGAGNVMVDVARHLLTEQRVDEVVSIVRRGPGEVNFSKDEMRHLVAYLDPIAFDFEMKRISPLLIAAGLDPAAGRQKVLEALPKADPRIAHGKFRFEFLSSPVGMFGSHGKLTHLEIEDNILLYQDGKVAAKGIGHKRLLPVDTVIFAIGDKVDESFGLPVERNEYVKRKDPRFPIEGVNYESTIDGIFVGGWSRKASDGLVGYARKDGVNAAKALWEYLQTVKPSGSRDTVRKIKALDKPVVFKEDVKRLDAAEAEEAQRRGLEEFKFSTNQEMLQAIGMAATA